MNRAFNINEIQNISDFSSLFSKMGEDYIISRLHLTSEDIEKMSREVKLDGLTIIIIQNGSMEILLNTDLYSVGKNSLTITSPNTLLKIKSISSEGLDCYMLFISTQFITSINIDLNAIHRAHMGKSYTPTIQLPDNKSKLLGQYMEMLHINALSNTTDDIFTKNISRSLIAALVYQMMQIVNHSLADTSINASVTEWERQHGTSRVTYLKEFMALIHQYYTRERSVGFYASKLCISPKYLSFLIKETTGRSAAEWIDQYVIIEAKNMLRFSGMNVQEVAYALNFSNQSSFGKYFKHLTGMSPTQFQKN